MMYIAPNTIVRCLSGVPIDSTYRNTLWFNSEAEQTAYFISKTKHTLNSQSYQRADRGFIKVNLPVEQLYDCNYIMFQNTSFGNKWFYAFITGVSYTNNVTATIQYAIDVMQTWFFNYTLGTNFVSREHSVTDNVGENILPEGLETGEYTFEPTRYGKLFDNMSVVIAATFDSTMADAAGGMYGSLYTGLYYHAFPINVDTWEADVDRINYFISQAIEANKVNGILSITAVPTDFISARNTLSIRGGTFRVPKFRGSFGNYIPKNNKLYTYPYCFIFADTKQGLTANYRFEDFSDDECQFDYYGDMSTTPSCIVLPENYKGSGYNWNEKLTITNFPQLSFNVDAYKAYMAQSLTAFIGTKAAETISEGVLAAAAQDEAAKNALNGFREFVSGLKTQYNKTGIGQITGNIDAGTFGGASAVLTAAALSGGFTPVYNELSTMYAKQTQAPQNVGANNSALLASMRDLGVECRQMHIKEEFAQSIDNYFTMFGYATRKLKTPNRNSRPHWNYVKLVNTHIEGNIPFDHEGAICSIYDNGITFWKNPNEVGHYELDNRPI